MANTVITIARQYGASGRFTGELLSGLLGIPCYDKELITMAATKSGMHEEVISGIDEKPSSSLLYTLAVGSSGYNAAIPTAYNVPINDKLFITQSNIIKELSVNSSCIIVGRCADYCLREYGGRIAVFLQADMNVRAARVAKRHDISMTEAQDLCMKTDKKRASYYNHYTGQKWGRPDLYDLIIDTTDIDAQGAAAVIMKFIEMKNAAAK